MSGDNNQKDGYNLKLMGVSLLAVAVIGFGGIYIQKNDEAMKLAQSQTETTIVEGQEIAGNTVTAEEADSLNAIAPVAGDADSDPVVAIVNDTEIKRSDVMPLMEQALEGQMGQMGIGAEQLFPLFLDQYVSGELVLQEAKKADIEDRKKFKEQMEMTREQIMRNVFLVEMAEDKVTEEALKKLYVEKIAEVPVQEEVRASHILVEEEQTAKDIIASLKDGADFAELAKEKSTGPTGPNGGDLGYFLKEEMVPEFAEAAFSMDAGDVSDAPVQTQFGWHVIKVADKRERPKPTYDEVKDQLEEMLRKQILDDYLNNIREGANVTLFDYNGNPLPAEGTAPAAGGDAE